MVSGTEGRLVEPDNAFFPTMSLLKTGKKKKTKKRKKNTATTQTGNKKHLPEKKRKRSI